MLVDLNHSLFEFTHKKNFNASTLKNKVRVTMFELLASVMFNVLIRLFEALINSGMSRQKFYFNFSCAVSGGNVNELSISIWNGEMCRFSVMLVTEVRASSRTRTTIVFIIQKELEKCFYRLGRHGLFFPYGWTVLDLIWAE